MSKPKVITEASAMKQNARNDAIKKDQQKHKKIMLIKGNAPSAVPVQDKYIFGLKNNANNAKAPTQTILKYTNIDTYSNDTDKYKPLKYSKFFEKQKYITTKNGKYCCYINGSKNKDLIFVCIHGAGHSGLSYALLSKLLIMNNENDSNKYQIFTFDQRGHGNSIVNDEYNMSKDNLVNDIIDVLSVEYSKKNGYNVVPPIILVGHSLGGALAVHVSHKKSELKYYRNMMNESKNDTESISDKINVIESIYGICVIDVVEGTALNSLTFMRGIINKRQKEFNTIEEAIKYCVFNNIIKNIHSAKASVECMLKYDNDKQCYIWRTDVLKTEKYWRNWFINLSDLFLTCKVSKMLMLADTNRLDKKLTIGQMQGKYQLCIMGLGVGHTIHEDSPDRVCAKLLDFVKRNKFIQMFQMNQKLLNKKPNKTNNNNNNNNDNGISNTKVDEGKINDESNDVSNQ